MKFKEVKGPAVHAALTLIPILLFLLSVVQLNKRVVSIEEGLQNAGSAETQVLSQRIQKLQKDLWEMQVQMEELKLQNMAESDEEVDFDEPIPKRIQELEEKMNQIERIMQALQEKLQFEKNDLGEVVMRIAAPDSPLTTSPASPTASTVSSQTPVPSPGKDP